MQTPRAFPTRFISNSVTARDRLLRNRHTRLNTGHILLLRGPRLKRVSSPAQARAAEGLPIRSRLRVRTGRSPPGQLHRRRSLVPVVGRTSTRPLRPATTSWSESCQSTRFAHSFGRARPLRPSLRLSRARRRWCRSRRERRRRWRHCCALRARSRSFSDTRSLSTIFYAATECAPTGCTRRAPPSHRGQRSNLESPICMIVVHVLRRRPGRAMRGAAGPRASAFRRRLRGPSFRRSFGGRSTEASRIAQRRRQR